ncbi:hypothetical protein NFI96_023550, partial [Prochilodus magdalenae]
MGACSQSLLLGLLIITCLQSCTEGQSGGAPKECCFSFFAGRIPAAAITKYEETRNDCPRAGVIFTTKKNARVCLDPGVKWLASLDAVAGDDGIVPPEYNTLLCTDLIVEDPERAGKKERSD